MHIYPWYFHYPCSTHALIYVADRNPTNLLDLGKDDVIVVSYPRSGGDHVSELLQNIEVTASIILYKYHSLLLGSVGQCNIPTESFTT